MPRSLRIHVPGAFHHVTIRGNHQQAIFRSESDRLMLNDIVARALETCDSRIHAYCWMSNHLHLLVEIGNEPLGTVVRQIASPYARAFQRRLDTTGHLFERRYHSKIVDVDAYLLAVLRYIHLNPVTAHMCATPAEHRWSSHHAYAGGAADRWLTTQFVFSMFGSTRAHAIRAYLQFVACAPPDLEYPLNDDALGGSPISATRSRPPLAPLRNANRTSLEELIAEACLRFGIERMQLFATSRDAYLAQVRGWIASQALKRRIANLSEVARAVGRDRFALRQTMRRYPLEVE